MSEACDELEGGLDFGKIGEELQGTEVSRLVGRTIVKARREPRSDAPYQYYEESLFIELDDGSMWTFIGDGYDASRLEIYVKDGSV